MNRMNSFNVIMDLALVLLCSLLQMFVNKLFGDRSLRLLSTTVERVNCFLAFFFPHQLACPAYFCALVVSFRIDLISVLNTL